MSRSESRRVQGLGRRLVCGVGLLLGSLVLLAALGEVSVRLCPSGILPDEVQQWLADDLGVYDPSIGTLAQRGVESLDLTPIFQQWASTGELLFFPANRYPNAQGQALIAQEVVRHLTAAAQTYGLTP